MNNVIQPINLFAEKHSLTAILVVGLILAKIFHTFWNGRPDPRLPTATLTRETLLGKLQPSYISWMFNAKDVIARGRTDFPEKPFQVSTGSGYKVVVPNRYADELRNHADLNFNETFSKEFFVHYPGFDGLRAGLKDETFIQEVVRVKLTQSLGLVTDDLVDETSDALQIAFGADRDWHTISLKENLLDIVARLSSRVFLGKELCRNKEWLRITKDYTVDAFISARLLRMIPDLVRPVLYWFVPTCARLRREVAAARRLIMPEVERRRVRAEKALAAGKKPPKAADAIGWMVEVSKGRDVDYVAAQLSLSLAAIHTTSETSANILLQLCETPEVIEPLRQEVTEVLSTDGWSKVSLYKMKLMDSFLKEVQRVRGLSRSRCKLFSFDSTLTPS